MRPTAAGTILDASILVAAPSSIYVQTLLQFSLRELRPLIIPVTVLYEAVRRGANPADFDAPGYAVNAFTQTIVPAVAAIAAMSSGPISADVAHTAWEAQVTGFPVLTANPRLYKSLSVRIDIETI